ncbi:MAG TPA: LutB/LldF family L-lactate oxidation iron-sulfur protein [Magnetospirillaceae bacterium]|jgi:L-lactate dehydrogenase complex protein LldF
MATAEFRPQAIKALADPQLRANFRRAMDGLMGKRAALFAENQDWRPLRALGAAAKINALANLPELLERLEAKLIANGVQVHWAETVDEGNAIVKAILAKRSAKRVVKGKSMVSEEMHLNHALEADGIEAIEADLGEYIIQLDHETPSHIIVPAIHKNRKQIAKTMFEKIKNAQYSEDVDELTALARRVLREKFEHADVGITGVNFAVVETGTLVLVENEGNGRMCTTVPPVHIAIMGLEKVVERFDQIPALLNLLVRSATGQPITTYVNMITGPRRAGEKDGPEEMHVVILDNGRSRVFADPELRDTLRCIRCGACMNHCPVYTRTGGHAYPGVYPGPIGKILTPQMMGLEKAGDLPHASALCEACTEICPVQIPITDILVRLRREGATHTPGATVKESGSRANTRETLIWQGWRMIYTTPALYRLMLWALARFGGLVPPSAPGLSAWTQVRAKPRFAKQSLHDLATRAGARDA